MKRLPWWWLALLLVTSAAPLRAQDADRGSALYMSLPGGRSCVSCHGPDPENSRNNILRAANDPQALVKALNTVSAMGFLRPLLDDTATADVAAFLGSVAQVAGPDARISVSPLTADFGSLGVGAAAGPQRFRIRNRGTTPMALSAPAVRSALHSVSHDCPIVLPAGASCTANVTLVAGGEGTAGGSLAITSDATSNPVIVALAGTVQSDASGVLSWVGRPAVVDFGNTPIPQSTTRQVTLVNGGSVPALLGSSSVIGPNSAQFTQSGCERGSTLPASGTCVLSLTHTPTSTTAAEAIFQLRSDGSNPAALVLQGASAFQPAASVPAPTASEPSTGGGAIGRIWLLPLAAGVLWLSRNW